MKTNVRPNKRHAIKLIEIISHGLVAGLGEPKPGELCVEAAVCLALGLPHDDKPPCVGKSIRDFKIALNDSYWSSNQARAKGMARLAIAQLESDKLDQKEFSRLLALRVTQKLLPNQLRDYAQYCKPEYVEKLNAIATDCENSQNDENVKDSLDRLASLANLANLAKFLTSVANIATDVLIEMKSPGCRWLDLVNP